MALSRQALEAQSVFYDQLAIALGDVIRVAQISGNGALALALTAFRPGLAKQNLAVLAWAVTAVRAALPERPMVLAPATLTQLVAATQAALTGTNLPFNASQVTPADNLLVVTHICTCVDFAVDFVAVLTADGFSLPAA